MNKRYVGMAKHFSKKYGNKGWWAFDYLVSAIWNQFLFCQDACQCLMLHPYTEGSCEFVGISMYYRLPSWVGTVKTVNNFRTEAATGVLFAPLQSAQQSG